MFCSACGEAIEPGSKFCRHCGARQSEDGAASLAAVPAQPTTESNPHLTKILLGGIGILALTLGVISAMPGDQAPTAAAEAENVAAALEASANALEAQADAAEPKVAGSGNWEYSTDEDKVRGKTTYYATTTSTNTVFQASPYESDTRMRITVRKSPAYGTDVIMTVSSGQLMCPSYDGCGGTVRFDDGTAQRVRFNGAADNSSETIFVEEAQSFLAKLKKSKRVIVEKTLYQAGNPQFEFDVAGLKWDH